MQIGAEQLQQHLKRGLQPLYTVFGDETLLALEAADRIRAAARAQGYGEREVLTCESGFNWSELAHAGSSQSLFSMRKLLELRVPTGKPGTEGSAAIQAFCARVPEDTVTIVQLPGMDWRAQKASWFEALGTAGVTVEAQLVARKALPKWLAGRLKAQNQNADDETLEFIADRVEGNLLAAYQEVQKLALLFPAGELEHAQVREAVLDVARYDVFNLGSVMLEGDAARFVRTLDGLKGEGAPPPLVLWALSEEIRILGKVLAGVAAGKPPFVAVRDARVRGGRAHQDLVQRSFERYSQREVDDALRHAGCVDRMIKGLGKGDLWAEFLQLGMRFARREHAPVS